MSEVFYHPLGTNLLEQWFELHNNTPNAVDLSGWRITRGVDFTFPTNTSLAADGYLVVAADRATFVTRHSNVANFVAGWVGTLGQRLRIEDTNGQIINELEFFSNGDWATRRLGELQFNHRGWEWYAEHDGLGKSLELVNPNLPNTEPLNWTSSLVEGGTPGGPNSAARTNVAPLISSVAHRPIIPRSSDPVTISARLQDEHAEGVTVVLRWRVDGVAEFNTAAMYDDGAHDDGLAGDGIFGVILPPQANGTVVEFYLEARDLEGNVRVYPAVIAPPDSTRTANLLYQVDNGVYGGDQPVYRIIMREVERAELYQLGRQFPDADSDAQMNATWISVDSILEGGTSTHLRYNVGVRNRGHGTRTSNPNNYHVNIPADRAWKGLAGINLNAQYAYSQVLGSAIFRRLGVPMADSRPVQVRVNSTNLMTTGGGGSFGSYAANEQYNNDFVKRSWPLDPNGNSYRGIRGPTASGPSPEANLAWQGADFFGSGYYTNAYFKQNNFLENDFSDLIELIGVLNVVAGYSSSATYVQDIQRVLNVEEWMKYMAINTLLDNDETCLANGSGDDYALYRGVVDRRFIALPYDLDTVFARGLTPTPPSHSIWRMTALAVMDRFMKRPEFAPVYFYWLQHLAETAFSRTQMDPLIQQTLGAYVPQNILDTMKTFNANQVANVLSQFPRELTVSHGLTLESGYPHTTNATVALFGTGNAIWTRRVLVNGAAATWTAWRGTWTNNAVSLRPGLNRVVVQALGAEGQEVSRAHLDLWYDDRSVQTVGGTLAQNATWTAAEGPYQITSSLIINSGVTLTIQAGTTLYLGSGVNLTVNSGGCLVAEGATNALIRFGVAPGAGVNWGGITINGGAGTPETRLRYVHFEGNGSTAIHSSGGTVLLDHLTFGATDHQYVSLDSSSFVVSHCSFPTPTAAFEPLHGSGGIKTGGHGLFYRNYFGAPNGYNDVIDFTGNNRPGQPLVHFIDNVFIGSGDDLLDLDGTDAWVEGNLFMHAHKNGSPDSSSAVSGGNDSGNTSEITVIGNLIYDCDQAATGKQGNFYTLINNTIVHQSHQGGSDTDGAVVNFADEDTTEGAGMYLEGNIIYDAEKLTRDLTAAVVTFTNNLMPFVWSGRGGGNSTADPRFRYVPRLEETTNFTSWEAAQVMRQWFSLEPGSPAIGTGPSGRDLGCVAPLGASLSGEPSGTNQLTTARLIVGVNRTGSGIPTAGFPNGSGYVAYKYRLDGGAWSAERSITTPITLTELGQGPHYVEVSAKMDTGLYQDDPLLGEAASVTRSHTWMVDTNYVPPVLPTVRLNEVLALNRSFPGPAGTTPDLVELYNAGATPVDLGGFGLTDRADQPYQFTFPTNVALAPGACLVLYADSDVAQPGLHLGFNLKAAGDDLYLYASPQSGGALLDAVTFGAQLADYSIGRMPDGTWTLCHPTFGAANFAVPLGESARVRINEWLADAQFAANNDFVELYNPDPHPAPLGGLFLSDASGSPDRYRIAPLSFIAAQGFVSFVADGQPHQGLDHLNFRLSPEVGLILLSSPDLTPIDAITYGPQRTDVSQGRSPSGSDTLTSLVPPTSGGPNPTPAAVVAITNITQVVRPLLSVTSTLWRFDNSGTDQGAAWRGTNYDDAGWSVGYGLFGRETTPQVYPYPFQTPIPAPGQAGGHITVYYRTHFTWDGSLTNFHLLATNYVDDGAVYYINSNYVGNLRVSANPALYTTTAANQPNEGAPETLTFSTDSLVVGDNVMQVEVHQVNAVSADDVFGMSLDAVQSTTNIVTRTLGVPVVLNEVLAANQTLTNLAGRTADYVELYNPTTNTVELAGLSLSNDPNEPRKWVFPAGATLRPQDFAVVYCDRGSPVSSTNTGFALSAQRDAVYLFLRAEGLDTLVDAVRFGLQTPDYALGRMPTGTGNWTLNVPSPGALNEAAGLASVSALRINEWMADPASGSDWFELYNTAPQPVALGGLFLTDVLTDKTQSPIEPLSFIGTGANAFGRFIADGKPAAGADHVNFNLKKSGEALGLFSPTGTLLDGISFGAQITGVSQGRFPDGSPTFANFTTTASPGEPNYLPLANVVINEVLTHTDPPLEDAVELYNPTADTVDLSGWYLSNSKNSLRKFRVPEGTTLPGHGFAVFYETNFNTGANAFTFSSAHGDWAILSQADALGKLTGYRAEARFGAAENGVSLGRYPTSMGVDFTALSARTFGVDQPTDVDQFRLGRGALNVGPKVGPVVISEILYYSATAGVENPEDEYIELLNIAPRPAPLYDPEYPTNTWGVRGAVDFTFPTNLALAAGERLLLVGFPPSDTGLLEAFRAKFGVPADVRVFGPWDRRLANDSDQVELVKPDTVQLPPRADAGFVPPVLVDKVHYSASAPWPTAAASGDKSLQRLDVAAYGNEPANWFAAAPAAGRVKTASLLDADHDGMPDQWEQTYFHTLTRNGQGDFDGDGMSDLQEYLAGTDPTNPAEALQWVAITYGSPATLRFFAIAHRTYTVQYRDALDAGAWRKLTDVPPQAGNGVATVTDSLPAAGSRYYRLVTPAQP